MKFLKSTIVCVSSAFTLFVTEAAFAATSLGDIAQNGTTAVGLLAHLMMIGAYMIAFGFGMGTLVHYKSHRDNPSQVPLSKPITMLFIALAFAALGTIFLYQGHSSFNHAGLAAGISGVTSF